MQRLNSHIKGAAHIEVTNGEVQGGNLHSVTFQSLDIDIDNLKSSSAYSMLDYGGMVQDMGLGAEEALVPKMDTDAFDLGSAASILDEEVQA